MGGEESVLTEDEIEEFEKSTTFSEDEIKNLYKKFQALDKDGNGAISYEEFKEIPELSVNPLLHRIMSTFGLNQNNEVEFKNLINSLNIFNLKGDMKKKLEFCFKIYDIDGDGFISNGELFTVLKIMVGKNLTDYQLQQIVDKTILEADTTNTGKVNFEDFCKILNKDIEKQMSFDISEETKK